MTKAKSELMVERAFRAALSQMGSHVACAKGPVTGANTKKWVVEHTISVRCFVSLMSSCEIQFKKMRLKLSEA